jgi:hypothetical protein
MAGRSRRPGWPTRPAGCCRPGTGSTRELLPGIVIEPRVRGRDGHIEERAERSFDSAHTGEALRRRMRGSPARPRPGLPGPGSARASARTATSSAARRGGAAGPPLRDDERLDVGGTDPVEGKAAQRRGEGFPGRSSRRGPAPWLMCRVDGQPAARPGSAPHSALSAFEPRVGRYFSGCRQFIVGAGRWPASRDG